MPTQRLLGGSLVMKDAPVEYDQAEENIFRRDLERQVRQISAAISNVESMNSSESSGAFLSLQFMLMGE
jgi:hypothetical protein|tara:strand:+ start:917 stop:1123 length:207 start_codon:yes stop_codon:yes gene_type:complete